ncbi:MAG: magnesium/cobalt transporter CorA [Pseudomonadales bacterium]|nr:magnesium/cobalt transporter CorA [Pseudomonadales bacterium]MCP5329614.1 magnesium/cobalt transporter CorA [Pseudomonadales bacterium]MCP5343847.1 magnesium/cobalt transporter CorA [Pseudomonadales bacterium]
MAKRSKISPKKTRQSRLVRKRGKKVGAPPGTLLHVGDAHTDSTSLSLATYNQEQYQLSKPGQASELQRDSFKGQVIWLNIEGVHDATVVQSVGELFGLHPLVMEDILNTDQRPKMEVHEHYLYIVLKVLNFDANESQARVEQISLILGKDFVLSFQESKDDIFQGVRTRLESGRRIRALGPDYLCYALIDTIVDNYFMLLEQFGDQVELLEEELLSNPSPETLQRIHHYKREMLLLRKAVWPLREVLTSMIRDDSTLIQQETQLYLRDVYDHTIHIMDTVDTIRDLLAGMLDLYISSTSNRMNEIMKVLTIFASIFMPLTFIAGIYGMNFQYMPELAIRWAYPAVMIIMALIGVGLALYFRWKKWL